MRYPYCQIPNSSGRCVASNAPNKRNAGDFWKFVVDKCITDVAFYKPDEVSTKE